jgi:uncharacterized protein YegP (UPF0339 family)
MAAKFEIYEDAAGGFRFRLKAGNGEVVATGESYTTRDGVLRGIDAVRRAAAEATMPSDSGSLPDGSNELTNMRGRDVAP